MVPFRLREGLDEAGVDAEALDEGLVTLVRESLGTAAEVADQLATRLPPEMPVRLRIEQLSSVEHASVLGVPVISADGAVQMTGGTGRPLVVSTLERAEAMRVLADGARAPDRGRRRARQWSGPAGRRDRVGPRGGSGRVRRPGGGLRRCLEAGVCLLASFVLAAPAFAADPTASPAGGDVRTSSTAPGLVGDPLFAMVGVVVIGLVALGATLLYVRLTARP